MIKTLEDIYKFMKNNKLASMKTEFEFDIKELETIFETKSHEKDEKSEPVKYLYKIIDRDTNEYSTGLSIEIDHIYIIQNQRTGETKRIYDYQWYIYDGLTM